MHSIDGRIDGRGAGAASSAWSRKIVGALLWLCLTLTTAAVAPATEPIVWVSNTRAEILRGEARGVSVTDTGALTLAPQTTQLFDTAQAYVWSSAVDAAGNVYLGTGHDGRIFRVGADGRGALFTDTEELDVTALAVGGDGALYAGTSPEGKVYRVGADGRAAVFFDPPDKYIWSIAVMPDGALAIGTGDNGKIYRARAAGEKPESSLLIDVDETHVISLAVDARGQLIAGTDPGGLVLRVTPDGKAFALFDSPLREIHAITPAPDNSIYVLALSDAASISRIGTGPQQTSLPAPGGASVTVSVTPIEDPSVAAQQTAGATPPVVRSRNDLSGARSAVFRLTSDGGADVLWSSSSITAFSIAATAERVLIGTGEKGRIYSVANDSRDTLLLQTTEDQISALLVRGRDIYASSSNQGKLFRAGAEIGGEGTYESPVRDAKFVSTWGRIWWRGSSGADAELQTRSGNTERPDATWSDWSAPYKAAGGAAIQSPRARFIQWRAVLRRGAGAGGATARLEEVSLAYLPSNAAPEVLAITTLPIGVGLQSAVPVQPDPNIESSGLNPTLFGPVAQIPPRRIYQRGALSLQWQAEDRNGDNLEYAVYYRAAGESNFRLLKKELRDNFYTVDGAALPDGQYYFKITASDRLANPIAVALAGERVSELIEVDNTPPTPRLLGEPQLSGGRVRLQALAEDKTGTIKKADVSVDGGDWQSIVPEDGIADGPRETYAVDVSVPGGVVTAGGEHAVSLRIYDASGNVGSLRATVRPR